MQVSIIILFKRYVISPIIFVYDIFFSIKIEFQIVNVNADIYINKYLGTIYVQHLGCYTVLIR